MIEIAPGLLLAVLVGVLNTALFVLVRGSAGGRLPLLGLAAILGAAAGDWLGDRVNFGPLRVGDFHLLSAMAVSWAGIAIVAILSILGPARTRP